MNSFADYLNTPKGINNIILIIILVGIFNTVLLNFFVYKRFGKAVEENKRRKIQKEKLERLSPKSSKEKLV